MKFPFTFNDSLISNFNYTTGPTTNGSGSDTTICDGYGTVIGLSGNSFDALRTQSTVFDTSLSWIMNPFAPFVYNSFQIIYNWYTLSHKGPYATLKYTYQTIPGTNQLIFKSKIFKIQNNVPTTDNISGINNIDNIKLVNSITADQLKVDFNDSRIGVYRLSIYSINGKLVHTELVTIDSNFQSIEIPVHSYNSGMYIVRFELENQFIGSYKFLRE